MNVFGLILLYKTGISVAFEVFYLYLVYTPDRIILASGYCITCLTLIVVLEPSSADLYLEAKVVGHAH